MPFTQFPKSQTEVLQHLYNADYCYENVVLAANQGALVVGQVVEIAADLSAAIPAADGATISSGDIFGILVDNVPNSTGTQTIRVLRRGPAIVRSAGLVYTTADGAKIAIVKASLAAQGIALR